MNTEATPPPIPDHELVRRIGRGSYGEVWLARNPLGEFRAVKLVYRDRFDEDRPYEREFEGISYYAPLSLSHPSLLRVLHVGKSPRDDFFYYVMELADGADAVAKLDPDSYVPNTLRQVLKKEGLLPLSEALRIADELATALDYLHHNGLVHRDIKPSNIVFVAGRARLADIGLVTRYADSLSMVGAEGYRPDSGFGTPQGDLYALGKVLYEMSTGLDRLDYPRLPDLRQLPLGERRGILELNRVVLKACDHTPPRRYPSAARLRSDLALLAQGTSLRLRRQLFFSSAALGIVVCALTAGLIAQGYLNRERENSRRRELLIREATLAQSETSRSGWSTNAASLLQRAAGILRDHDLVEHEIASRVGLDARPIAFRRHAGTSVAFGPDGAVACDGEGVRPGLRFESDRPLRELVPGAGAVFYDGSVGVRQFRFNPSGPWFEVRDLENPGAPELRLPWPANGPEIVSPIQLAASENGTHCVALVETSSGAHWIIAWAANSNVRGRLIEEPAITVAISQGGEWIGIGCRSGATLITRGRDLEEVARLRSASRRSPVTCVAFGRNAWSPPPGATSELAGWLLGVGDSSSGIMVWDLGLREVISVCRGSNFEVTALAFHPDGATLASAGRAEAWLWDIATGQALLRLADDNFVMDHARALAISRKGDRMAVTTSEPGRKVFDGSFSVWQLEPDRGIESLRGLRTRVAQLWFSSDGARLAGLSHDWQLAVWDVERRRLEWVMSPPPGATADNAGAAFLPEERTLLFASGKHATLYSLTNGHVLEQWDLPPGYADHLLARGSQKLLLRRQARSGDASSACQFWTISQLESEGRVRVLHQQTDTNWVSYETALDPAGRFALVVGHERSRERWQEETEMRWIDLTTGQEKTEPLRARAQAVYFDAAGRWGAVVRPMGDGTTLFEVVNPAASQPFPFKFTGISADGHWLAYVLPGAACALINRREPSWRLDLAIHHPASDAPAVFSPASDRLAWGTAGGTVLVAPTQLGAMEQTSSAARRRKWAGRALGPEALQTGSGVAQMQDGVEVQRHMHQQTAKHRSPLAVEDPVSEPWDHQHHGPEVDGFGGKHPREHAFEIAPGVGEEDRPTQIPQRRATQQFSEQAHARPRGLQHGGFPGGDAQESLGHSQSGRGLEYGCKPGDQDGCQHRVNHGKHGECPSERVKGQAESQRAQEQNRPLARPVRARDLGAMAIPHDQSARHSTGEAGHQHMPVHFGIHGRRNRSEARAIRPS
jgi:serine/threonine protein kinase/WD40 repeat protein